jgi:tripartite-type tricarboxylate transporter receptor subunit TctC
LCQSFFTPAISGTAMPLVQSDQVKAIAVTSSARSPVLPDLPTVAEGRLPRLRV